MIGQNNEITVYRLVADGESKESYDSTAILSDEPCYIEPLRPDIAQFYDQQNAFYLWSIYCEGNLDIKIGDKCIDQQGKIYIIQANPKYSNNPDTGDMTQLVGLSRFPST